MHEIDNEQFGQFLLQLRREKALTQRELAERLYVSDIADCLLKPGRFKKSLQCLGHGILTGFIELIAVAN